MVVLDIMGLKKNVREVRYLNDSRVGEEVTGAAVEWNMDRFLGVSEVFANERSIK